MSSQLTSDRARWLCSKLAENGEVTREEFINREKREKKERDKKEPDRKERERKGSESGSENPANYDDAIRGDWTRIGWGIYAACQALNVPGMKFEEQKLSCARFEAARHESAYFSTYDMAKEKEAMGNLVAQYLMREEEANSLFIGSGSSAYWVGRAMARIRSWSNKRQICTINIALLSYWSELTKRDTDATGPQPPTNSVKIPEGLYDPEQFRYTTMQDLQDQDEIGIAVVGADGCKYNPQRASVYLFSTSDHTGQNTIRIVKMASIAVICCLTADKISTKPPTGPCLRIPSRKDIPCYLVTDKTLTEPITRAFRNENWFVVTGERDWAKPFE
jgi:hypothetical protein